ncbi:MAG TPA: GldG family protein [Gammaproteobacteria bacterium]
MDVTRQSRRRLKLESWGFVVLFLAAVGLIAWLSTRYHYQSDWTAAGRHTLSEASRNLLAGMEGPIQITSFTREADANGLRQRSKELVQRYQDHKPDITLNFVDPDLDPERVRAMNVSVEGEMVVEYKGRRENLKAVGEQALTNALQRLARSTERTILFLEGHGERSAEGIANHDLSEWTRQLKEKGFKFAGLNLSAMPGVPDNISALVIASPQVDLLPGEVKIIEEYVARGGNLLWLAEPGSLHGLEPLAKELGITFEPGTIVDPTGQMLGINHPALVVVAEYPKHPVTADLNSLTLFPFARPLKIESGYGWEGTELLRTLDRSWSESGPLEGSVSFDQGKDLKGPLTIAVALTRAHPGASEAKNGADDGKTPPPMQRIAVFGDGDFLSNSYVGNGANLDLGNRLINWLSNDDSFIAIPPRTAPDTQLEMSSTTTLLIGGGFLALIPLLLLTAGIVIWLKRRKG